MTKETESMNISEMTNDPPLKQKLLKELRNQKPTGNVYKVSYFAKKLGCAEQSLRGFTAQPEFLPFRGKKGNAVWWGNPRDIAEAKKRKVLQ